MARIIRPVAFGAPDVLVVHEVEAPQAGPGEVVVHVRAAGVNPVDWKLYSGSFHAVDDEEKDAAGLSESLPAIGLECAGVVTAIGDGVDHVRGEGGEVRMGDEVIVYPVTAAYADYVVAPTSSLVRKPTDLSWAEAGGLMLAGTTAAHALHAAEVASGDTVLIHGGSGGVGLMAVQLATSAGADVVATASPRNHALIASLGATPVSYGDGLLERVRAAAPRGVDAVVDAAGTDESLEVSLSLVGDPGRIASIVGQGERRGNSGIKLLGYGPGQDAGGEFRAAARAGLAERAGSGGLRVVVAETFPLTDASRAHAAGIAGQHQPGKLILIP